LERIDGRANGIAGAVPGITFATKGSARAAKGITAGTKPITGVTEAIAFLTFESLKGSGRLRKRLTRSIFLAKPRKGCRWHWGAHAPGVRLASSPRKSIQH